MPAQHSNSLCELKTYPFSGYVVRNLTIATPIERGYHKNISILMVFQNGFEMSQSKTCAAYSYKHQICLVLKLHTIRKKIFSYILYPADLYVQNMWSCVHPPSVLNMPEKIWRQNWGTFQYSFDVWVVQRRVTFGWRYSIVDANFYMSTFR